MVVFKDFQKLVSHSQQQHQQSRLFERLRDKPFWIWNVHEHKQEDIKTNGDCWFNHIIGLPTNERIEKPIIDYEKILYDSLLVNDYSNVLNHAFKYKHLWIKKSNGLGVTEFFLRLMAWLCLRNDNCQNSHIYNQIVQISNIYSKKPMRDCSLFNFNDLTVQWVII